MSVPMYTEKDGLVGCARFGRNEKGKPDMISFTPAPEDPLEKLKVFLECFFKPGEVGECDWAEGFYIIPRGWAHTWLTVYCSQTPGVYSLYEAIPDLMRGIDIEDEKEVRIGTLQEIEAAIRKLQEAG